MVADFYSSVYSSTTFRSFASADISTAYNAHFSISSAFTPYTSTDILAVFSALSLQLHSVLVLKLKFSSTSV